MLNYMNDRYQYILYSEEFLCPTKSWRRRKAKTSSDTITAGDNGRVFAVTHQHNPILVRIDLLLVDTRLYPRPGAARIDSDNIL